MAEDAAEMVLPKRTPAVETEDPDAAPPAPDSPSVVLEAEVDAEDGEAEPAPADGV